jgi:hypothetical protein
MGEVETLLSIFGIEGELQSPSDLSGSDSSGVDVSGGGYFAGSTDGTEPSLYISTDAMQYWNYSPPISETVLNPACFDTSDIAAVSPPTPVTESVPADSVVEPDGSAESEPSIGDDQAVDDQAVDDQPVVDELCPDDQLPQNVPTEGEAVELFSVLMSDIGVDADDLVIEAFSDDFGATVVGFLKIDGVRSPLSWTVSYADAGRIVWASGILGEVQKLADYGRIGTGAGIDRLNEQQSDQLDRMGGGSSIDPAASTGSDMAPIAGGATVVEIIDVEE